MGRAPVLIAGMHRSGTSMVARLLNFCGLYLGEEIDISSFRPDENPEGFWEDPEVMIFGDELLVSLGGDWAHPPQKLYQPDWFEDSAIQDKVKMIPKFIKSQKEAETPWGWKDPRNMILLPFWRKQYPNLRLVVCLRNPLEVALSLVKRIINHLDVDQALLLWQSYHEILLASLAETPYIITHYESYYYDPEKELNRVCEFAGLDVEGEMLKRAIKASIKSQIYRSVATDKFLRAYEKLPTGLLSMYDDFCNQAGDTFQAVQNDRQFQKKRDESVASRLFRTASQELQRFYSEITKLNETLTQKEDLLLSKDKDILTREKEITQQEQIIHQQKVTIEQQKEAIGQQKETIGQQKETIGQQAVSIRKHMEEIEQKELSLHEMAKYISKVQSSFGWRILEGVRKVIHYPAVLFVRIKFYLQIRKPHRLFSIPLTFDEKWYLREYPDVARSNFAAFNHYLCYGWKEARNPNPYFDTLYYLRENPVVADHSVEPLAHYLIHGWREGRNPSPRFNTNWYLEKYKDVKESQMDPLTHYLVFGIKEGRVPGPDFDFEWHRQQYPEEATQATNHMKQMIRGSYSHQSFIPIDEDYVRTKPSFKHDPQKVEKVDARHATKYHQLVNELSSEIRAFDRFHDRYPTILNWQSPLEVTSHFPECSVAEFEGKGLPYIGKSIDIVLVKESNDLDEAHRVATHSVYSIHQDYSFHLYEISAKKEHVFPSVSIVIPVYNHAELTKRCLENLFATVPGYANLEVVVVDDGSTDETPEILSIFEQKDGRLSTIRNDRNIGFIHTCNRGAEAAQGDYLVFLNNDTIPCEGWLEALINTFLHYEDAGVVGGKILFPDGSLQEAGSVIFNNGEGYNFGTHAKNPQYPLYSHFRTVDYCSGAMLATPRELFNELGGFDPEYAPAYYEDTDYCMKVRESGYQVYYQPLSSIIHDHHGSYTEDNLQLILNHRAIFIERWQQQLENNPSSTDGKFNRAIQHRLVSNSRRVLICGHILPYYDVYGGAIRPYNIMLMFKHAGWHVSYFSNEWRKDDERYIDRLSKQGIAVYSGSHSPLAVDLHEDFVCLVSEGNFDVIVVNTWEVAQELVPMAKEFSPNSIVIVDSSDLYFQRIARSNATSGNLLDNRYGQDMVSELNTYASADGTWTVSPRETQILSDLLGIANNSYYIPNIINQMNYQKEQNSYIERRGILMVGFYYYPPNAEMVEYMVDAILPHISKDTLQRHPLYVVGDRLPDSIRKKIIRFDPSGKLIRLTGWVPSIAPYRRSCRIMVVPLLSGSGTKSKVIDVLASGLPTVSTSIGAEDLGLENGVHILIEDDPEHFADSVENLLQDEDLWNVLKTNGAEYIEQNYGLEITSEKIQRVIQKVHAKRHAR